MQRRGARKGSQHVPSPEPVDITAQIDGQLDDVADFHAGSDEIAADLSSATSICPIASAGSMLSARMSICPDNTSQQAPAATPI